MAPALLELVERRYRAPAGREHRVEQVHARVRKPVRQALVVVDRFVILLVAVDPDVPDARVWQQPQKAFDHPEAGAQDRHDRHLVAEPAPGRGLERGLDLDLLHR